MNDYQNAKQASYKLITKEAKSNPSETSLIPSFANGITRLDAITVEIDAIGIQQAKDITGVTKDKNSVMTELMDYVVDVSGAVNSYAITKGDNTLQTKVNFKESAITKMSHADLRKTAAIVLEEAEKIAPADLANEGITATEMADFKAAYNQFHEGSSNTREAIIDRSGHTQKLLDLFEEASDLKKNLDRLASQFKRKAPEFYQKYTAAANVIYKSSSKIVGTDQIKPAANV